jgi:hypothetical protein
MAKTQYLQYTIHLTDPALVATLQGTTDPGSNQAVGAIIRAPYNAGPPPGGAAIEYNAPILPKAAPFVAPCITSPWFDTEANFPLNVATFTRKSGGWFGIAWLFGTTTRFYWRGIFAYSPDPTVSPIEGEAQVAMARRRWVDGFELAAGEGGSGNLEECARGASRHLEGFGFRLDNTSIYRTHVANELVGGGLVRQMWERFYIRPHVFGTSALSLWKLSGASTPAGGVRLSITTSGQLLIEGGSDLTWAPIPIATVDGLTLHTWTRIDVLWRFYDGAIPCAFLLCLDGALKFSGSSEFGTTGLGQSQLGNWSRIGDGIASNGHVCDVDDWIGSDWPTAGVGPGLFPGLDWNNGSRVTRIAVDHASATNGTWTGPSVQLLKQRPLGETTNPYFSSSTASDRLSMVTDAVRSIDRIKNAIGIAALIVGKHGSRVGPANGQLGYKFPGAGEVLTAITEQAVWAWNYVGYVPSGVVQPLTPLEGLEIVYVKDTGATGAQCVELQAVAEVLGQFYEEDKNPDSDAGEEDPAPEPRQLMHHNAAYPRSPWALAGPPPFSPIEIVGGTYVGNGTLIELPIAVPVHFLFIRNVTDPNQMPMIWTPPLNTGHGGGQLVYRAVGPVEVLVDPAFPEPVAEDDQSMRVLIRLVGTLAFFNAVGKTYQYIAFCDPGMRFCLADVLQAVRVNSYVQPLGYAGWTPEYALVQGEDSSASTDVRGFLKGIGHTTSYASQFGAAEAASSLTLAENALTVGSALVTALVNALSAAFILWRRHDGNNDPGEARVLQLATYVGDGAASRTISLAPASGRRPLFAIVTPHNGVSYWRDPSHTTTSSYNLTSGATIATAITSGGIDQITVGSTLNGNGIVHDVFVLPGSATAGNGGWSINGEFYPVEPEMPDGGDGTPWDEEPDEPSETPGEEPPPGPGEPGGPGWPGAPEGPEEDRDFSEHCLDPSVKIMNKALSYIGISKQIGNILTELSVEAVTARLHYSDDASATLRDYPWAFATRYELLTLVRGPGDAITLVQAWTAATPYLTGDTVRLGATLYYCVLGHTNHTPPNVTYWTTTSTDEANGDWMYAYRAPSWMIFARRIVNPDKSRRDYDPDPPRFRVGTDNRGTLIYTEAEDPELEYTYRLDCVAESGDSIFRKALTWRHAASLAPTLSRDEKKVMFCLAMYQATLEEARVRDAREQQQSPEGDVDWITGRN